jgi:hypothetical protein
MSKNKNEPDDLMLAEDSLAELPAELTERQRSIYNLKLRGLTQAAIAKVVKNKDGGLGVSQPMIAKEWRKIKQVFKDQGRNIDQEQVVGESVSLYQEVEQRAWEMYFTHKAEKPSAANKALDTVMAAREKTNKLMMDLGILQKAKIEHEHTMTVAPFFQQFDNLEEEQKQNALRNVIDVHLGELEEPEPPQLLADLELEEDEEDEAQGREDEECELVKPVRYDE